MDVDFEWGMTLTRHGALLEMAFEIRDVVLRIYERLFDEHGEKKQPNAILKIVAKHHALTMMMCIPMNLYYPNEPLSSEIIVILSGAAGAAGFI